jgi:hypothetical protein
MSKTLPGFIAFSSKFPVLDTLPYKIGPDEYRQRSQENQPITPDDIALFLPNDPNDDDTTEFIPCFRIPAIGKILAFIYWSANLQGYYYHLVTFDKDGNRMAHKMLGGSSILTQPFVIQIITIREGGIITIAEGISDDPMLQPSTLHPTLKWTIDEDGKIHTF